MSMNITSEQKYVIDNILMKYIDRLSKEKFKLLCRVYYDFIFRLKEQYYIEISTKNTDSLLDNIEKLEEYFTKNMLPNSVIFVDGYVTCLVLHSLDKNDTIVFSLAKFQMNNSNLLH